jgi:hypothetical protein
LAAADTSGLAIPAKPSPAWKSYLDDFAVAVRQFILVRVPVAEADVPSGLLQLEPCAPLSASLASAGGGQNVTIS